MKDSRGKNQIKTSRRERGKKKKKLQRTILTESTLRRTKNGKITETVGEIVKTRWLGANEKWG